eukprot:SAG11_NODE_355_length_10322_cov_3.245207_2_plen_55_part_00
MGQLHLDALLHGRFFASVWLQLYLGIAVLNSDKCYRLMTTTALPSTKFYRDANI